jgi:hypothetical protein
MRILGDANWWAPRGVRGWISRLGFYEELKPELKQEPV